MSRPARGLLLPLLTGGSTGLERVADGVWRMRANPGRLNLYFLEEANGGVTQFDAGGRVHLPLVRSAIAALGPLKRVVLSHAHTDHRGTAPFLGAPVVCHPDEVQDAQGTGGLRYWGERLPKLAPGARLLHRHVLQRLYDGGPVRVADTIAEGELVAGFRVVHLPGHAPGVAGLANDGDVASGDHQGEPVPARCSTEPRRHCDLRGSHEPARCWIRVPTRPSP